MNETQRQAAVGYLENGGTLEEVAAMCGVSWRAFSAYWIRGKREAEDRTDSEVATFYREAQAARARCRATLRAEAREEAGSRSATDKLAVLKALEDEVEPMEVATGTDNRINLDDVSPETQMELHAAFGKMVREQAEARAGRAAA